MIRIAADRGYDLSSHRACQIAAHDLEWADDILAVDTETAQRLRHDFGGLADRVQLYLASRDVPDPYGQNDDAYVSALELIEFGARPILDRPSPRSERAGRAAQQTS
jgi:protein-tyrosine phosphatase